jgi:Helix-turn-helix of DDE superfamily endonuclease
MLFYRAALPLSSRTLTFVSGVIRRYRISIGSCWRKLNPGQQALLVLAYLRKGETFAELAAGFAVGTTTAWRYVTETVELLAARAPKLRRAIRDAVQAPRARRAGERPAQNLENPAQAPLLPLASRPAREGHPRIADARGITRMERVH